MRRLAVATSAFVAFASGALCAGQAHAAIEEFENWSVRAYELDDENGLDDLHRSFTPWDDWRWRTRAQGARVGMGCATTQFWEVNLDAKLEHWLSRRVGVAYRHQQQEELGESVTLSEFAAWYRTPAGWWGGGTYRPSFDKELHDAGLFAGWRADSARWVRLHLGFEDALNNFWEGRTEYIVDKERRRYRKNPRELEIAGLWREGERHGAALRAAVVPRYVRHVVPAPSDSSLPRQLELSGWLVAADLFRDAGRGWTVGLRGRLKGCDREDFLEQTADPSAFRSWDFARLRDAYVRPWFEKRLAPRWKVRALGQARWSSERHEVPLGIHLLETHHAGGLATAVWSPWRFLDAEVGLASDWVRVRQEGPAGLGVFSHGTRNESRAIVTLDFHWNGAHLVLIETFEGNNEGYQTVGFHDKGFARLVIEF